MARQALPLVLIKVWCAELLLATPYIHDDEPAQGARVYFKKFGGRGRLVTQSRCFTQ